MDYAPMVEFHWQSGADITVAVQPVARTDASRFGILKRDQSGRISDFVEKPADPVVQESFISRDDRIIHSWVRWVFTSSTPRC